MNYELVFHGSDDSSRFLFTGPTLTTTFQNLCEELIEPAAQRCLLKFNQHEIEILPEDILEELADMLTEYGFKKMNERKAILSANTLENFKSNLGKTYDSLISYNKKLELIS